MGTPELIIYTALEILGAHSVWSTLGEDHTGSCALVSAGVELAVFPDFSESFAAAMYAVSPDGGYSEVEIVPAAPGRQITHHTLLDWL